MADTIPTNDSNTGIEATTTRTSGSTAEPAARLLLPNGHDTDRPVSESQPSFHLREEWPKRVLGADGTADGRGLVVCTVDVQLLTSEIFVCLHGAVFAMRQSKARSRSVG